MDLAARANRAYRLETVFMEVDEDNRLVTQALAGNNAAFAQLVHAYEKPVFQLAYILLRDEDEAEDVAQEAFFKAYTKLHKFKKGQKFKPWILAITKNEALNRIRSIKAEKKAVGKYAEYAQTSSLFDLVHKTAENNHAQRSLLEKIARLKESDQQILVMKFFLDLSEEEMAGILECPKGTVKSRLARALEKLRKEVEHG